MDNWKGVLMKVLGGGAAFSTLMGETDHKPSFMARRPERNHQARIEAARVKRERRNLKRLRDKERGGYVGS